ncbi:MAG: DNA-packaging protein [Rhodobacteraceae bacterium]|nr:DNA-packaging protein [Paracoccaceae bacterium]
MTAPPVAVTSSTSPPPAPRSGAAWLASAPQATAHDFLAGLGDNALAALPWLFEFWAQPHQLPPPGAWRTWVALGGRGAGKTRAGAEWVRARVEGPRPLDRGAARRVALLGETYDQVREVMIFGDSGILACSPPDRRPRWEATRRRLIWPNGATATAFSANDPEALRGPQFDAAWADELAKWPNAESTWDMLQFALRLGTDPRAIVTTTPRNQPALKRLLAAPSTVTTHAPTEANRAFLAPAFLAEVRARYAGTREERQELDGVLLDDAEGTLWPADVLARARRGAVPALDRVVVAVDPAVSAGRNADLCGIVVAGAVTRGPVQAWCAYVLEDASLRAASPGQWGRAVIDAAHRHNADRVVAEVNQGGDMVAEVLRSLEPLVPFRALHARQGKGLRAEPVAALYEQGRVFHTGRLGALEDQMALMTAQGFTGRGSPDRVDALVWALHELMIAPARRQMRPGVRSL